MSALYESIFAAGCVKFGGFKLKSGIMSPVYCDLRMLVSAPAVLAEIGQALGEKAKEIGCDRIAGIPYGGVPIAVAASIASGIPMIYPRKEVKDHGTKQAIEGIHNARFLVLRPVQRPVVLALWEELEVFAGLLQPLPDLFREVPR